MLETDLTSPAQGELKQLTILFADLAGSTALCEGLTPEAVHELINAWVALITDEIYREGGIVTEFAGDAVMAIFGAPIAYEDAPQRACRAGLAMQHVLRGFNAERCTPLQMRIGIDTGESFVGDVGNERRSEYTALGHRANLAKRVQEVADRGSVTVSHESHVLIAPYFETIEAGEFSAKGLSQPLRVFRVLGERARTARLDVTLARWRANLVGRETPLAELTERLEAICAGGGQRVLLEGEPGVGKSRLAHELRQLAATKGIAVWEARARAHGEKQPYGLAAALIRGLAGITDRDDAETLRIKLRARAPFLGDDLPFLDVLFSVDEDTGPLQHLDAEARKAGLFATVRNWVRAESESAPVLMILDDMHWADPLSREMIEFITADLEHLRLFVLLLTRPGADVATGPEAERILLPVLTARETRSLIEDLLQTSCEDVLFDAVYNASGGNPLFVEEVLQALIARGVLKQDGGAWRLAGDPGETSIPSSLHDLIAARVDRLSLADKLILQNAAVAGAEVSVEVLDAAGLPDVRGALARLASAELLRESSQRRGQFRFKHGVTWQVALNTVPRSRKATMHERIGCALEKLHAGHLDAQVDLLAHHFANSTDTDRALHYLRLAARRAERAFANENAVAHYSLALEKGAGYMAAATEVAFLLGRAELRTRYLAQYDLALTDLAAALAIAERSGSAVDPVPIHMAKGNSFVFQYRWADALECLDAVLTRAAAGSGDWIDALIKKGFVLGEKGDSMAAAECLEQALVKSRESGDGKREVQALIYMGKLHFNQTRIDQALATYDQCILRCREIDDRASLCLALQNQAITYGLGAGGAEHSRRAVEVNRSLQPLLTEMGDKRRLANSFFNSGLAFGYLGEDRESLANYQEALRRFCELGIRFWEQRTLEVLRMLHAKLGSAEGVAATLEQLLPILEGQGSRQEVADVRVDLAAAKRALGDLTAAEKMLFAAARDFVELQDATRAISCLQTVKDLENQRAQNS